MLTNLKKERIESNAPRAVVGNVTAVPPMAAAKPINCPCCNQPVATPSLEMVVDRYHVPPMEARILGAIWKGKGHPVQTERIFDAMYVDDPDGGPSQPKMYNTFKVALCHLRKKLEGSGMGIANVGNRQGYRLQVGLPASAGGGARKYKSPGTKIITVNGEDHEFTGNTISHRQICDLAGKPIHASVTYEGPRHDDGRRSGTTHRGKEITLEDGMIFDCVVTGNA